ncbi:ATP-binding protein [Paraburkholderia sp. HD33-4]|uniref:ATP-binding protein n=1 Tax=Paraburkholderia sp. HD33-4 TaxID=2883242 RepID=UPI002DD44792|nr:ATP-binding protein [Paraburkholderia sp. HD33-4]
MQPSGSSYGNGGLKYLVPLWIGGCIALGAVAAACFRLQLRLSTTGFCLLIVIVVLSLKDSFISSAIFSVVGAALLDFFFTSPLYSFRIAYAEDYIPLVTFFITSIAVTTLVRRINRIEKVQRAQARLLDLTHDTVFVRDQNEVITYWNHAAETLYGWKQEEATGKVADELLRTLFPLPREEIQQLYIRDGHWEGELVHTKRDGSEVIVASRWTMQRDEPGALIATLETNNDITERKRAEEWLRKSQAQYLAEAQKLSRTGSFGWNVSTGTVFWSEQAFNIFEYDVARTPTIDMVRQRVHPDDMQVFEQLLAQARGSKSDFDVEHRLLFPDGRIKHLQVVVHRTTGQADSRQFIGAVMDVTEAKQTEEQLRQAQNELARASRITALGELSASIAHEVGQPLAAIITNAEAGLRWLRRQPLDVEEIEACMTQITGEGNRAAEIVQRVRKLMKGAPPDRALVEVNELIDEVVTLIRGEVKNHGGSLVLNLAPGLPAVLGDRVQLQQVLINIIINGVQAMATVDGERELAVQSGIDNEENVVVAVRDSGPGISEENLSRLFEAFFTTRSTGMGMGLAICSSIIEAHGGHIWASNNPEGGSTFSFSLPPARVSAALV